MYRTRTKNYNIHTITYYNLQRHASLTNTGRAPPAQPGRLPALHQPSRHRKPSASALAALPPASSRRPALQGVYFLFGGDGLEVIGSEWVQGGVLKKE